ncbi:acyl-CoA dehydratase activase [Geosporobacter ferrireducens]|uniref:2-hydroxyglutaryl-CoA dehydratase n=1 Tax=Geosporobacter ferrireducens TaxID=1424294 RepID=A0A1D8GK72_9FIRM|nr:acyl-CoA dehydratase activase [Geosporobacter ferrireducens]AOT71308.1 2-hydroxyglutaryl-CoA dehydratase [Geosporobacter ferrireducens]
MFFLGIDIGSSATKLVVIDKNKNIVGRSVVQLGTGTSGVENAVSNLYISHDFNPNDITGSVVTGYGRKQFRSADTEISEISCHAKGVSHLCPSVRTIIDIGGQDTKIIRIDEKGKIQDFTMNDKCAAGTGRFISVMSKVLDVDIADMGSIDKEATEIISISNTCAVFAESEVISKLSSGFSIPNIVAGIHQSVARRVAGLAYRNRIEPVLALTGGVAQNMGMIRALEQELNNQLIIPYEPQLTGALGAALFALENNR